MKVNPLNDAILYRETAQPLSSKTMIAYLHFPCTARKTFRKQQSDLDVGLDCGLNDEQYLRVVMDYLPWLMDTFKPDLILYDAGVDPHQDDVLGKLCLTDQGTGGGQGRLRVETTGVRGG